MANTGQNLELCYDRIIKILREDKILQTYVKKVFRGARRRPSQNEVPCINVGIGSIADAPVSDQGIVVDATASILIGGISEIFDDEKAFWKGANRNRGLAQFIQDIKHAFKADSTDGNPNTLNGNCNFYAFTDTTFVEQFPIRAAEVTLSVNYREEIDDRVRNA